MRLSDHFTLTEFASSDGAPTPDDVAENLRRLAVEALEPVRARFGKPITILSGYRSKEHNRAVGGAPGSQHLSGQAADIRIAGIDPALVADAIDEMQRSGEIPLGGLGRYDSFTHLDIRGRLARWSG